MPLMPLLPQFGFVLNIMRVLAVFTCAVPAALAWLVWRKCFATAAPAKLEGKQR